MPLLLRALILLCACCALGLPSASFAQRYPARTVRWIVPYAPGGFIDLRARQVATRLSELWGQSIVVENRAGAGGVIGVDIVSKAPPDGYTLGTGNLAPMAANVSLMKSLPYDPLRDLVHVVLMEKSPLVLMVNPSVPAKNVAELVAVLKANPGKYTFGSSGVGGPHHLSGEIFRILAGVDITHVPYKGGAPAGADLMAGHLPMMFEMTYAALPSLRAGRARPIAVTSEKRLGVAPEVPTFVEAGYPSLVISNWQGVIVPRGTAREIVDRINESVNQVLAMPAVRESILAQGNEIGGGAPEVFTALIRSEIPRWAKVVKEANIQIE
ncbi:MAG: tripartite tricarboxylate transporter substrate binding protein [Betaproteobacteria bacterium]|nr:tripartite tricarboxylate transporter substrate binding protein [Betaproteobacteria bacterium]